MKKLIFITLLLFASIPSIACDVCGGGGSGAFLGIVPQFERNIVGLRYQYQNFSHPLTELNFNNGSRVNNDYFHRKELWFRTYPHKRIQLMGFIPYAVHQRREVEGSSTIQSPGDFRIMANYMFINTGDSINVKWKNTLMGGLSLNLPTGKYRARDYNQQLLPPQFQPGTGAFGTTINMIYTTRIKKWGLNFDAFYTFNTTNESQYRFGNQLRSSLLIFRTLTLGNYKLMASAGGVLEHADTDYYYGAREEFTGGTYRMFHLGMDAFLGDFMVTGFIQKPFSRTLPYSQPDLSIRFGLGLGYFF